MNAHMQQQLYRRHSRECLADLVAAVDALPGAVAATDRLAADGDKSALERLERIAERLEGLRRLTLQARAALMNESREDPEAA